MELFSLKGKTAIVTGALGLIGKKHCEALALAGANVVAADVDEKKVEAFAANLGEQHGGLKIDVTSKHSLEIARDKILTRYGGIDILVNNAGEQHPQEDIQNITKDQLERTFRTNIFSFFYMTKAAAKHLPKGGAIVNTTSVTAYRGSPTLLDYSATKGAIVAFTRSLSKAFAERGIRVNAVAPGPIWTPLIPSTFPADRVASFGKDTTLGRPGEPEEVAPSYVFLASDDGSYFTGQVLHPNGGEIVNA